MNYRETKHTLLIRARAVICVMLFLCSRLTLPPPIIIIILQYMDGSDAKKTRRRRIFSKYVPTFEMSEL